MKIRCTKDGCIEEFEWSGRATSRRCPTHSAKITNTRLRRAKGSTTRLPIFPMFTSDPYRMYLYHLEKMKKDNLPVVNKSPFKWWTPQLSIITAKSQ